MTLDAALERYRSQVSVLKKGYVQESYRIEQLRRAPIASRILCEITSVDIASYRDTRLLQRNAKTGLVLSSSTVRLELALLSNLFDIARIEWGACEHNPVTQVRKPKPPPGRDRRLLPREERLIMRYAHAHPNRDLAALVSLALETAMRQGELLGLRWERVNLRSRIIHLDDTKNGTKRDVPLSVKARNVLLRLEPQTSGEVFHYTANGLKSTWRFMLQKLGIVDLHFHDLRHEAISRLFELGTLDLMEVAAISGHKSLSMLKRYTHLRATRLVRKLEGHRNRGRQAVLDLLVPYPAAWTPASRGYRVIVPDFQGVCAEAPTLEQALEAAQAQLLKHILCMFVQGQAIPQPDEYLTLLPTAAKIVMLPSLDVEVAKDGLVAA
ncbi:site-specific integrase [Pseudomonas oryzihabitans]|uniref:site-specific integrase n=1 Tax=Pseudomonas oryzihabitans TaxID=47885 RepID=UPI002895004B|nr:site-specific integrase [Pseudomonas oryzihabitans]MDT3723238.1 site-specific integrase [Pseudomonas oryzihabitans]